MDESSERSSADSGLETTPSLRLGVAYCMSPQLSQPSDSSFSSNDSSDGEFVDLPKQTARKSTATTDSIRIASRRSNACLEIKRLNSIVDDTVKTKNTNTARKPISDHRPVNNAPSVFSGPVGLGKGKGSMKRIQQVYRQREIEERARLRQVTRVYSNETLMPLAPFCRLVHKLDNDLYPDRRHKFQLAALNAMKDICESYLIYMFETSNQFTIHAKRVTVFPKDINLFKRVVDSETFKKHPRSWQ